MTREEAIKTLKALRFPLCTEPEKEYVTNIIDMAIADMEKQMPKKVVYHDDSGNKTVSERCPICFEIAHSDYCEYCGQALYWTGEGEQI